jgi:TPR repeat protein
MGSSQSQPITKKDVSKVMEAPILTSDPSSKSKYPTPTGHEYDAIDKIASELPNVIDDESRQQVEDYKQACDNGKGPVVACFATGEYLSLFERRHKEAADLFTNVCFRPKTDKSPNAMDVDGSKAYPPGCYNLAKMMMTGKGGIPYDRLEGYRLLDRACRGDHGGACFLQAQILLTSPDALGKGIPHDPKKAMGLYQKTCDSGDSISCYTLAAMLLRGDKIHKQADNVSPQEARGETPLTKRENEEDRARTDDDSPYVIHRDPRRAADLLTQACETGGHVTSCHNLAVMYTHGDDGVPADPEKAELYKSKTQEQIGVFGGF